MLFELARDRSYFRSPTVCRKMKTCKICLEDIDVTRIISGHGCQHGYCFSCMKKHVEIKLFQGSLPKCPHEGCESELNIDRCKSFLTPKLISLMCLRIKEASIPVTERVYCPYPKCSALTSKRKVLEYTNKSSVGILQSCARKCKKCNLYFCIDCKVPMHSGISCNEYKRLNPYPSSEDEKLKSLAMMNQWRQCVKCNHMVELAKGCYHIICRCGHEFCYTCGAEFKQKMPTCSCPLWAEHNILYP